MNLVRGVQLEAPGVENRFVPQVSDKAAVQLNGHDDDVTENRLENLKLGFINAVKSGEEEEIYENIRGRIVGLLPCFLKCFFL